MKRYYFTFGCGSDDANRNCYHIETAESYEKAREKMVEKFGVDWAFQYTEDDWKLTLEDYKCFLYTGGEGVRTNLLKGRSSAKPEAHESLAHG